MKNLFDPAAVSELHTRLGQLRPDSTRRWGTMGVAQAVAHLANGMEAAIGETRPPRMFVGRVIGRFVKPMAIGNDAPIRRNTPTSPDLMITDDRDLDVERRRLASLIDRFAAGGHATCTTHPHTFFGRMTPDEWAVLTYKHVDHHLRQFGA